jgi:hypothetical protein
MDGDTHLLALNRLAVPRGLERFDGAELALRARRERRETRTATALVAVAALVIGMLGGMGAAHRDGVRLPFGPPVALTPLIDLGHG